MGATVGVGVTGAATGIGETGVAMGVTPVALAATWKLFLHQGGILVVLAMKMIQYIIYLHLGKPQNMLMP